MAAIINAAAGLMYENGVGGTAVEDVLVASGCGKSQFYHYFADKDDLAAAVLEHQLGVVLGELEQFRLDTWTGIRAWFDALLSGKSNVGSGAAPSGRWRSSSAPPGPTCNGAWRTRSRVGRASSPPGSNP
jgi:AcrR family transcriptional regulator